MILFRNKFEKKRGAIGSYWAGRPTPFTPLVTREELFIQLLVLVFFNYEHPLVAPHVLHLRHVPFLTKVKFPHSPQASPSYPFIRASNT